MNKERTFTIFFCLALAIVFAGWLEAWPASILIAAVFYGLYRWLGLEELLWFSVIFAVLTVALLATVLAPIGNLLLALLALLVGLVLVGWEAAVGINIGWHAWRVWRARQAAGRTKESH